MALTPASAESSGSIGARIRSRPAAFVIVHGDKDSAKERALKMVTPVVDLMQVAGAMYHYLDDVSCQMS